MLQICQKLPGRDFLGGPSQAQGEGSGMLIVVKSQPGLEQVV